MPDLEIWLIGTPSEVDTALTALAQAGRIVGASQPEPLYSTDTGRVRRYLRLHTPTPSATPAHQATGRQAGPSLLDTAA